MKNGKGANRLAGGPVPFKRSTHQATALPLVPQELACEQPLSDCLRSSLFVSLRAVIELLAEALESPERDWNLGDMLIRRWKNDIFRLFSERGEVGERCVVLVAVYIVVDASGFCTWQISKPPARQALHLQ